MSLHTTTRNRPLGNLEWSKDVANISAEPISLNERMRRLPSVSEGGRGVGDNSEVSREHVVDTSRLTIELEGTFSRDIWKVTNPYHIVMYGLQTPQIHNLNVLQYS